MIPFKVVSDFEPAGDQPKAIEQLSEGIVRGDRFQTLLGITGSGKSATIAWTIQNVQKPTSCIISRSYWVRMRRRWASSSLPCPSSSFSRSASSCSIVPIARCTTSVPAT